MFSYYLPGQGQTTEDAQTFETVFGETDPMWLAEDAAEWCHTVYDGWELDWPQLFVILREDGSEVCRATVHRESRPSFTADVLPLEEQP